MALTKVGGGIIQQPIDVGIITATSVNASGVITATSFDGNVTGDITGNVTGNVTGNLTGNVTGNADTASNLTGTPNITVGSVTATTGNFSGNLDVGGVLTYEDVTNVDSVGVVTARLGIKVPDSQNIFLGTGDDLRLYHNGTDSYVDNHTGDLILRTSSVGDDVFVRAMDDVFIQPGNGANGVTAKSSGAVELYYNNSLKLSTAAGGVNVAGNINLNSADSYEIRLGSNNDLKLYHDGTDSWIDNTEGDLYLRTTGSGDDIIIRARDDVLIQTQASEGAIIARGDGQVELYYNNDKKFETTTTGAKVTGTLVSDLDLTAIDSTISGTATDVFIYDTSKDSDGGAWRKRTQHTSWYNETLNTSTRGSRKEFPAVAVIVSTSSGVTIYDGDDPDLPMWMVFEDTEADMINTHNVFPNSFSLSALNANVLVGSRNPSFGEANVINFISDNCVSYYSAHSGDYRGSISQRNDALSQTINSNYGTLVNSVVNDIAMTVLPNAPIDDTTGLPVPTIAVATDRGVSIIKDNGLVVDLEHDGGTHETCRNIAFSEDKTKVLFTSDYNDDPTFNRRVIVEDIPSGDSTFTVVQGDSYQIAVGGYDNNGPRILGTSNGSSAVGGIDHLLSQAAATSEGVTLLDNELDNVLKSKVAYVTADYNTGWMVGDIKGAFLSDTDTTNATYTTVADDWATAGAWTKQSSISVSSTGSGTSGTLSITGNGTGMNVYFFNPITVEANTDYVVTITFGAYNANAFLINNTQYSTSGSVLDIHGLSGLSRGGHFNSGSNTTLYIQGYQVSTTATTITNVVVQKVSEKDRSVNNTGLEVHGTITKSAVATGAELVAYSGFSGSNVLVQPYNSNLDPGTGDYSFMCWIKCSPVSGEQMIMRRFSNVSVTGGMMMRLVSSSSVLQWYVRDTSSSALAMNSTMALDDGYWHCVVGTRQGNNAKLYIDGKLNRDSTCSASSHNPGTDANLVIGAEETIGSPGTFQNPADLCSLALVRYSLSAPSVEQVKKMYEDEKMLFQENAKATLYGSSDAVTALAYDDDTDLLHVGTSSGRSDFQGLCRINNTTTAVTTAITAQNEFIIEQ